jgi:ectoine hydroxylase-related dioxygenase (phytanoyl-CoA dioxygenase family)
MSTAADTQVNENPARFRSEGYCVFRDPLPEPLVAEADRRLGRMIATMPDGHRPEWLVEPHMHAEDWRYWLELCRTPSVLDDVASCLGCEELMLMMSHLIVKPAGDGLPILWHQDNTYWPSVDGTDVVTVWLAIDDADLANGCMQVIPCTHAGYPELEKIPTDGKDLLKVTVAVTPEMVASAVPVVLPRGTYSIHDSFVIHGSEPNRSARRRGGYTMRYGNAATVKVDTKHHNKPVYYVRGDGTNLRPDYVDLRPGRPLPDTPKFHERL